LGFLAGESTWVSDYLLTYLFHGAESFLRSYLVWS